MDRRNTAAYRRRESDGEAPPTAEDEAPGNTRESPDLNTHIMSHTDLN